MTTASYTGEVTAEGIRSITYTVTYLGTPVETPATFHPIWLAVPGAILLILVLGGIVYAVRFRPNAVIYASKLAQKLTGRIITIQMYGGSRTHLVEPYDGQDSYWFAIKEDAEEKEDSK